MLYDQTPVYPYQENLPFAHEPLKSLYVSQRLATTIAMVPLWVTYYSVVPRSLRPRPSWSLKQIVCVNFMRRIHKVTEVAGVTWGTRDPEAELSSKELAELKETRFEWIPPLEESLRTGIVLDPQVIFKRVGTFVWPKDGPVITTGKGGVEAVDEGNSKAESVKVVVKPSGDQIPDVESNSASAPVIGIFLHGGGYCHMSAHETAGPSRIPRRLIKDGLCTQVYAVEYRLLQHDPLPAAIQDAASVYGHVVLNIVGATKGDDGVYHYTSPLSGAEGKLNAFGSKRPKILLIGDSAGGNLILGLTRWIRDEGVLPMPDGLFMVSPSCDPSHAFPLAPSAYIPRPHASTDYLVDTPEPRAQLQRAFLGHHPIETIHSPYISPASPRVLRAYGHSVEWEGEGGDYGPLQIQMMEAGEGNIGLVTGVPLPKARDGKDRKDGRKGKHEKKSKKEGKKKKSKEGGDLNGNPRVEEVKRPEGWKDDGNVVTMSLNRTEDLAHHKKEALEDRKMDHPASNTNPQPATFNFSVSPPSPSSGTASPSVSGSIQDQGETDADPRAENLAPPVAPNPRPTVRNTQTYLNPAPSNPDHRAILFADFPPSFVVLGDAERLERECGMLVRAMQKDGVSVRVHMVKDGVHDCLILKWWDEKEREKIWEDVGQWVGELRAL
ncbi:hypothetical protein JAAARDRAFT_34479 [Jaapia argillacea MUCL 33604]|uniref:Alpha/beta hydrolase fold-3 domain-containing protein n=1 Tax=Jaapia argillacea MUCL 33604 TaxID=933084 RepID=A0A067PXN5_9AGAM|nr:hypothetical protein JAAARDRAFT_34479 [Jaapia argillacea MUCL 33604]